MNFVAWLKIKRERTIGYYEQALAIDRKIGDRHGEEAAFGNLGIAHKNLGDARRAIGYLEQALGISREIGDRRGEGQALRNVGIACADFGDARRAIGYYEKSLAIAREISDRSGENATLCNLGIAYETLGDARRAIEYYEKSLAIAREISYISGVATESFNIARLYTQQNEPGRALPLAQEAARIWVQIGSPYAGRAQQLVSKLQGGVPAAENHTQAAFEAFQRAGSSTEMQAAAAQFPFMTEAGFLHAVEQVIATQVPPQHKPAFEQRLAWLRQITGK